MDKRIELVIIRLENDNLRNRKLLAFLSDSLTETQVNHLLDEINANNDLIRKLKHGPIEGRE